jgi:hypothetical protein
MPRDREPGRTLASQLEPPLALVREQLGAETVPFQNTVFDYALLVFIQKRFYDLS